MWSGEVRWQDDLGECTLMSQAYLYTGFNSLLIFYFTFLYIFFFKNQLSDLIGIFQELKDVH